MVSYIDAQCHPVSTVQEEKSVHDAKLDKLSAGQMFGYMQVPACQGVVKDIGI